MVSQWVQVGTVEILRDRVYPLDPTSEGPLATSVYVEAGTWPLYQRHGVTRWLMTGRINERHEKIGDGLFMFHSENDNPVGLEVRFPSRAYGPEQLAELMAEPLCQPGPDQRLRFTIAAS